MTDKQTGNNEHQPPITILHKARLVFRGKTTHEAAVEQNPSTE